MYHNTEFSYIFNLLKSAARDVPDFYPDWVRNYSHLNRYDSLRQIKKEIPVKDYREQVPSITNTSEYIHSKILEDIITFKYDLASLLRVLKIFFNDERHKLIEKVIDGKVETVEKSEREKDAIEKMRSMCERLEYALYRSSWEKKVQSDILLGKTLSQALQLEESIISKPFEVETPVGIKEKILTFPAGVNIVSVIRSFLTECKRISKNINYDNETVKSLNDLSRTPAYETLNYSCSRLLNMSKSSDSDMEIVFSKQPTDLLSMSIRDDWRSCQYLLSSKDKYNYKAIHSTISPYCAIMYLTNKEDYDGMGERMLARALVLFLESDDDKEPILLVSQIYSNYSIEVKNKIKSIFVESLQRHSPLKVDNGDLAFNGDYSFPAYETSNSPSEMVPYLDPRTDRGEVERLPIKWKRGEKYDREARRINACLDHFTDSFSEMENYDSYYDDDVPIDQESCNLMLQELERFDPKFPMIWRGGSVPSPLKKVLEEMEQFVLDSNYEEFYRSVSGWRASPLPIQLSFEFVNEYENND